MSWGGHPQFTNPEIQPCLLSEGILSSQDVMFNAHIVYQNEENATKDKHINSDIMLLSSVD